MSMSPIEKQELVERVKGMTGEQIAVVLECVPDEALIYELRLRLGAFRAFFETIHSTTENALKSE